MATLIYTSSGLSYILAENIAELSAVNDVIIRLGAASHNTGGGGAAASIGRSSSSSSSSVAENSSRNM
jgi:phosphoribosylformylglycinamidine (FGAM) synthase-like enzyme